MPFSDFTNPYQNSADVPEKYRNHPATSKLFRSDGSGAYVRPAEDPVTMWAINLLVDEYGVPLEAMEHNGGSADGINPEEPTEEFIRFRDNHLFGAEYSRNVMHVARVNTLMNGAQYTDLKVMDSLERLSSITGGITEGLPARPGFYPGGLTMILTNPPFGSKVTNTNVLKDFAGRDGVTKKNGKVVKSIPQEVAFINRCLEFLAPGGKLAIVLPDGVLANSSMQDVRDWILRWARLKAVLSLPQATFAPYGAGVKTSIVVLEKRERALSANGQLELGQEVIQPDEDYEVYMARIDDIGYDTTGRFTVTEEETHFPPEVSETVVYFDKLVGWSQILTNMM